MLLGRSISVRVSFKSSVGPSVDELECLCAEQVSKDMLDGLPVVSRVVLIL